MSREEKISFLIGAIYEIEGVQVHHWQISGWSDEQIDKEVDFYDYLLTK
jgi:hypothetical protein